MAGMGNHDGKQATPEKMTDPISRFTPLRDVSFYKEVFAARPYPLGDAPPYRGSPRHRPPGPQRPGRRRDALLGRPRQRALGLPGQLVLRDRQLRPAPEPLRPDDQGSANTVHVPCATPRSQADSRREAFVRGHAHADAGPARPENADTPPPGNHMMRKGATRDNARFEPRPESLGVDGVSSATSRASSSTAAAADVPYFIDGGAGGELSAARPVGVDHGYWYGSGSCASTARPVTTGPVVPLIVPDGRSAMQGAARAPARGGARAACEATAAPAGREVRPRGGGRRSSCRDPDPVPRSGQRLDDPWPPGVGGRRCCLIGRP